VIESTTVGSEDAPRTGERGQVRRGVARLGRAAIIFLVLGGATVVNQSAVHWRENIADSDLFAYYGWCVSTGARPYLDIWDNKPAGIWWLNAAAIRLCGPGAKSDLALGTCASLVTLAAFVGLAGSAFHRSLLLPAVLVGAVLLTDLRFECGSNRTETFVVACQTLAVLGYVRWLRAGGRVWLGLAGLAAGAAPLFKQSGLAVTLTLVLHFAWVQWRSRSIGRAGGGYLRGWKPWLVAGGAWAVAPLATIVRLASQGALGEAAYAVGAFNRAYFAVGDATWGHIGRALRIYEPALAALGGLLVIAAIGLGFGGWIYQRRLRTGLTSPGARSGIGLFLLWFGLSVYLACVGPGRRSHHLMPALPALGLLVLYPLHLLAAGRGLRACLTGHPSAVGACVVWAYVLSGVATGSLNEAVRCWHTKPHWNAFQRRRPAPYELQAAEVDRLTRPDETIYVWGWSPSTYRYAYRRPASRFATLEKRGQVGEHARLVMEGAVTDILRQPPRAFVVSVGDHQSLLAAPASNFGTWLQAHYQLAATIEGMHVLIRRDETP
jgi:hypothetical protein